MVPSDVFSTERFASASSPIGWVGWLAVYLIEAGKETGWRWNGTENMDNGGEQLTENTPRI